MKFSIVIPLYNKEISITSTIESVLAQSHRDFELIVVNDGSTDCSLAVVKTIQDPRIKIIDKPNGGVSSARNRGIAEARCEWIAFLDGDDLWNPLFLETIATMIVKYPKANIISTNYNISTQENRLSYNYTGYINDYYGTVLKYSNIICSSAVCIEKKCFDKIGGFKEYLTHGEDLEMWSRIVNTYTLAYTPLIMAVYRVSAENRACDMPKYETSWFRYIALNDYEYKLWPAYYNYVIGLYLRDCISRKISWRWLYECMRKCGVFSVIIYSCNRILTRVCKIA
ncbi:MAG: glycosyltransferase [Muribaculaceae bacterium]